MKVIQEWIERKFVFMFCHFILFLVAATILCSKISFIISIISYFEILPSPFLSTSW